MSSETDVLGISVVRGMRRAGGVYVMCMCLARGDMGGEVGEWMRGLGLGFTNPVGTRGSVGRVSVFGLRWCRWGVGKWLGSGSGEVRWCYVCVSCESGFFV